MTDFRKFVNIQMGSLMEKYSSHTASFLRYMRGKEFDPYNHWWEVCDWLERTDHLDMVSELIGEQIDSAADLREHDAEIFYELPEEVQKKCGEDVVEYILRHDPAEAPTWGHANLTADRMLPNTTWLIHFTDDPDSIKREGFKIGLDRMDRLGLTTWFKNEGGSKKYGGYNFAFTADSKYAYYAMRKGSYGKHAVMFRNSGVKIYHYGDEEDQIVFWGADVDPKGIVPMYGNGNGDWVIHSQKIDRVFFEGSFENAIKWVETNYQQYRKHL